MKATLSARRVWFVLLAVPLIVITSAAAALSAPGWPEFGEGSGGAVSDAGHDVATGAQSASGVSLGGAQPVELLAAMAEAPAASKLSPALQAAGKRDGDDRQLVVVLSAEPVDLSDHSDRVHSFTWPAGEHVSILRVRASDLMAVAATSGVAQVTSGELDLQARPADAVQIPDELLAPNLGSDASVDDEPALDVADDGARGADAADDGARGADAADDGARELDASGGGPRDTDGSSGGDSIQGWHDVRDGHSAAEAWEMGYRGEGVLVGVLDTGVDYSHYDLQGTWPILPDGHAYAGWPQVYDPTSTYIYATARTVDEDADLLRAAIGGLIEVYQESELTEEDREGELVNTACFRPLLGGIYTTARSLGDEDCGYIVPESKGGLVRFGHHPDRNLAGIRSTGGPPMTRTGEYVGVLLVDAVEPGVFDTVYVDLDSDHDFTDEKPASKESPLSWRDVDRMPDGVADLSGGLLYYISDGANPVPGAYLWGLEDDVPDAGTMVGLFLDQEAHGTLCASNAASQGRLGAVRGRLAFRDLPGGVPEELNPGMAPDVGLVGIGNVYGNDVVFETGWRYVLFGHDPDDPADDLQIASNSYGWSDVDNDGWDADSRFIDHYVRTFGPNTSFLVSTGNGAPGYGTIAPPSPITGMGIGSSTQFGSAVGLSITDTKQITFGDIAEMSNRGPSADGRTGPDVTANGANGWGAVPINLLSANAGMINAGVGLGTRANVPWGGTSRSSPIAAGGLALAYEAFRERTGEWPTWTEARAIYKSAARYAAYDTFTMGAGVVDIADAVRTAAGDYGVYAVPSEFTFGRYDGERHPGFAKLMQAGGADETEFELYNPSPSAVDVTLSGAALRRLGGYDGRLDTMLDAESEYNSAIPNYLVPLDAGQVPEGTELVVVQAILPLEQADIDRDDDPTLENSFTYRLIQHTDMDGDGELWTDVDGNGSVGFVTVEGAIDWGSAEIDRYEFEALNEHSAETNNWTVTAHHPLERWNDGLYIGVWHSEMACSDDQDPTTCSGRTPLMPNTTMGLRFEFFAFEEWDWLELEGTNWEVPAGGGRSFSAGVTVPDGTAPGSYGGAILADYARADGDSQIDSGGGYELPHQRIVIPVNVSVSADYDWQGTVAIGGDAARDETTRLNNGALRGGLDRAWRPETGDWRFFFLDAEEPAPGTHWLLRTSWGDESERSTDIDTGIWSQAADRFSDPSHPDNDDSDWSDPAWYGPYTLDRVGASVDAYVEAGTWRFNTTSGRNEDWVTGPASEGLTELMLHNVLFSGSQFDVPFDVEVGSINVRPDPLELYADECEPLRIKSQIALDGFELLASGLTAPDEITDVTVVPEEPYSYTVAVEDVAARFVVELRGDEQTDLDLFVLYDENGDGSPDVELAGSESETSHERIELPGLQPAGDYFVVVESLGAPGTESPFELTVDVVFGDDLVADSVPPAVDVDTEYVIDVCASNAPDAEGPLNGVVVFGGEGGPAVMSVPVIWRAERPAHVVYTPIAHRP